MTQRIKSEEEGERLFFFFLPEQWKECRCANTAIFEKDTKLVGAEISLTKKLFLERTLECLPYKNTVLDYLKFYKGRMV